MLKSLENFLTIFLKENVASIVKNIRNITKAKSYLKYLK